MNSTDASCETAAAELVRTMRYLESTGLNTGTAGNGSCRADGQGYWITPSGVAPASLTPESIVSMSFGATAGSALTTPSSEWRMHHDIYLARPDVGAIIHTHSTYATALACARKSIPAFHYMVAVAGGDSIRCAPYATFGTR